MARRRSSAAIHLVLIGAAVSTTLAGCGDSEIPARDVYTDLESCRADWNQTGDCEPNREGRYPSTYYYGPRYYASRWSSGAPRASPHAMFAEPMPQQSSSSSSGSSSRSASSWGGGSSSGSSISRGGFGGSASAHGGGS